MEAAYTTEGWHELYVMAGGAAAVLMGLIFVALSLHLGPITHNPDWRGRARGSAFSLMNVIIISLVILIPGQPRIVVGTELLVLGCIGFLPTLRNQFRILRTMGVQLSRLFTYALVDSAQVVTAFSGLSLILDQFWGLYLLVIATGSHLIFAAVSSWQLMVAVGEELRSGVSGGERTH